MQLALTRMNLRLQTPFPEHFPQRPRTLPPYRFEMPADRYVRDDDETDDDELGHKCFTPDDDATLIEIMAHHPHPRKPGEWVRISREFDRGWSARQLHERWNNFLRPQLNRQPFTTAERREVLKMTFAYPRQWKYIAQKIGENGSRSAAMVKNLVKNLTRKLHKKGFRIDKPEHVDCLPERFFGWGFPGGQEGADLKREFREKTERFDEMLRRREIAAQFSNQALMAKPVLPASN
jgi:hypothetical protein